jgi:hypothetical protein
VQIYTVPVLWQAKLSGIILLFNMVINQGMLDIIQPKIFCLLSHIKIKIKIYRTLILPVVLYNYETWSLTLREEHD